MLAEQFLRTATLAPAREARIDAEARRLVTAIRASASGIGGIEALLREYSLSTPEGLALMVLAEGLLRVPDDATADRLIEDKLGQGGFAAGTRDAKPDSLLVGARRPGRWAWARGWSVPPTRRRVSCAVWCAGWGCPRCAPPCARRCG